ncbi:hypothetical protein [Streptomyces sp. NPDC002588]|uniref:hypothetical protein n=1 Tax=Streptomyces sp. NPDC002588 TaxID=3154419 RepID=UPI00331C649B
MRTQHNSRALDGTDDLTAAARVATAWHATRNETDAPDVDPSFEFIEQFFRKQLPEFGRHSSAEWRKALRRAADSAKRNSRTQGLGWLSTALVGGELDAVTVTEIGCEKVRVSRLSCGTDDGLPHTSVLCETEWRTAAADGALDDDSLLRHLFELARETPTARDVADALDRALGRSARHDDPPLVVAVRAAGWARVEEATALAGALRPAVLRLCLPVGWPRQGPLDLLAGAPLRRTLWFVAARVDDSSGAVGLARQALFRAGSTGSARPDAGGSSPVAGVQVGQPPSASGAPQRHSAFVVTARPADAPTAWLPVRADRVALPAAGGTTLRYRLDAPGSLRLLYDGGHEPETTAWPLVVRDLPRGQSAPRPVDLVVAVETAVRRGHGAAQLAERLRQARAVISATAAAVPHADGLWVGLIGYRDHQPLAGPGDRTPIHYRAGLRPAGEAARELAGWEHSQLHHDFATGLEHVPGELLGWHAQWRPGSLRVLLVVGARPPHPYGRPPQAVRRRAPVRVCPDRLDWESALAALHSRQQLRCLALVDPPAWMDGDTEPLVAEWARHAWAQFGRQGCFAVADGTEPVVRTLLTSVRPAGDGAAPSMLVAAAGPADAWLAHPAPDAV